MAHSIRLSGDAKQSAQTSGVYISDDLHARIWKHPTGHALPAPRSAAGNVGRFPFLSRLADPYHDATIWPSEVAGFRSELQQAATSLSQESPEASIVTAIIELATAAERIGCGLVCHGD